MAKFPRTKIDGLSVSRMIIGTNWFLGYSHTSAAADRMIKTTQTAKKVADVLTTFMDAGVDTILGLRQNKVMDQAIKIAEQRSGHKMQVISTPSMNVGERPEDFDEARRTFVTEAKLGCDILMPHQCSTDALVDRRTRRITNMDVYVKMIRELGMIPGLSTHMPETPVYADETDLDVATYIQIYNAIGFLMQIEVDWVHRVIQSSAKPVITIKPFAAGRLQPWVGLVFNWNTIREQDMVCVGVMTADEAKELIEMSLAILENRKSDVALQRTRSKGSVEKKSR